MSGHKPAAKLRRCEHTNNPLYVDPRGMDFYSGGSHSEKSDVGNYRLVTCIKTRDGEPVFIEFGGWVRYSYYETKSGKTRRKIENDNALYVSGQHEIYIERPDNIYGDDCGCFGYNFEKQLGISVNDYRYTRKDILRFCSAVSGIEYTELIFCREKVEEAVKTIYEPVEKANYQRCRTQHEKIEKEREEARKAIIAKIRAMRETATAER